jgi:hypothetical protein
MTTGMRRSRRGGADFGEHRSVPEADYADLAVPVPSGPAADGGPGARARRAASRGPVRRTGRWTASHPAWPITALLAGYPLWWALGVADFMWIILAVPMAARMLAWHRTGSRKIRVPGGFGIWLLFLVWVLAGALMLPLTAPGTLDSAISHRLISFGIRAGSYGGVTVLLLYAGNLTEREFARRRLAWLLGLVALAGVLVLLLSFVYMFTYVAVIAPLGFTMLAYALLWRGEHDGRCDTAERRIAA